MLGEFAVACMFLTRLPLRLRGQLGLDRLARAVWAFPIVGAVIGGIAGAVHGLAGLMHLPATLAAVLAVATAVLVTGALHEDGLADTADGLGAGADRVRALEIMRDSRLGSFGAIALVLSLMARVMALAALGGPARVWGALIAAAAMSRAAMPVVMLLQSRARPGGLAAGVGTPETQRVGLGCALALAVVAIALPPGPGLRATLALVVAALLLALWLGRRLGGCTGDTLGAVQQVGEVAFLMALAARL
jgi:adenosylcobinamide-GDP ribazoletransferase